MLAVAMLRRETNLAVPLSTPPPSAPGFSGDTPPSEPAGVAVVFLMAALLAILWIVVVWLRRRAAKRLGEL